MGESFLTPPAEQKGMLCTRTGDCSWSPHRDNNTGGVSIIYRSIILRISICSTVAEHLARWQAHWMN